MWLPGRDERVSMEKMDKEEFKKTLRVGGKKYGFYSLSEAQKQGGLKNVDKLPCGLKILLENLLRNGKTTTSWEDAKGMDDWVENPTSEGPPLSQGQFQFDFWGVSPKSGRYDWEALRREVKKYGVRNSLLIAPMPTASTS